MKTKRAVFLPIALMATGLIGWVDVATGPDIGLSLFYILPVLATARWLGQWPMVVVAIAASATWFGADFVSHGVDALRTSMWNGVTRLGIYNLLGWLTCSLRHERDQLRTANEQMASLLEHEALLARTDALTGLANSRAFLEAVQREVTLGLRHAYRWSVAYVDIDNFKKVNDTRGHAAGDGLLQELARALQETVRASDLVGRLGGDEFAVLLAHTSHDEAQVVMQRYAEKVGQIAARFSDCGVGASIGIAAFGDGDVVTVDKAVQAADAAMYRIKMQRKGETVGFA